MHNGSNLYYNRQMNVECGGDGSGR